MKIDDLKIQLDLVSASAWLKSKLNHRTNSEVTDFSGIFESGHSYGTSSKINAWGWVVSAILSGKIDTTSGAILLNGRSENRKALRQIACDVGEISFFENVTGATVRQLLEKNCVEGISIDDIVEIFKLTQERINHPIKKLSAEFWRANTAINWLKGKKVFCFPWMEPRFLEMYQDIWFSDLISFLTKNGAIVILPSDFTLFKQRLVDKVISI